MLNILIYQFVLEAQIAEIWNKKIVNFKKFSKQIIFELQCL